MTRISKLATFFLSVAIPTTTLADFSGSYAGLSLGTLTRGEAKGEIDGETFVNEIDGGAILGGFAGYQIQNGDVVFGGELALTSAKDFELITAEDGPQDRDFLLLDVKARAGYDLGRALIYGTVGLSTIKGAGDFDGDDTAEGFNFGFGADYPINNQFVVGAEYLARRVVTEDDVDIDFDVDTFTLRASFQF